MTLKHFLLNKMTMTGPYQPIIIRALLKGNGKADLTDIAKEIAQLDPDMIDYYISRLKVFPKQVLKKHGIAEIPKGQPHYVFMRELEISPSELPELIEICDNKISEWYAKHPTENEEYSGWGLKRVSLISKYPYCTYCGSRPPDVELDIDHILPRDKGGTDDDKNLQVLCHKCNRAKGNHLLPSAKAALANHLSSYRDCLFCNLGADRPILASNDYILAFRDAFPVSEGHTLIIPKRHVSSPRHLTAIEINHLFETAKLLSSEIEKSDSSIKGFTIGFNDGEPAGQTIFHAHLHVIPRRHGDTPSPRGGIRNVISGKGDY